MNINKVALAGLLAGIGGLARTPAYCDDLFKVQGVKFQSKGLPSGAAKIKRTAKKAKNKRK